MSYREPGVQITQQKNTSFAGAIGSFMPTCIVAPGFATLTKTFQVVRGSGTFDAVVDGGGDYVTIDSVTKIGNTRSTEDYNIDDHLTDYTVGTETIDGESVDVITWSETVGAVTPSEGSAYYVTAVVVPSESHYELKTMTSIEGVIEEYGPDVDGSGNINPISLAAQIALENAGLVFTLKVEKAGVSVTPMEYQTALEKIKTNSDTYRIIPVGMTDASIGTSTITHVRLASTPEEGMERVTLLAAPDHSSSTAGDVITNVGGYAEGLNEFRAAVPYPDAAKRTLSDGNKYTLSGGYITAALAALKSSLRPEKAYTGEQITNFEELVGVNMTKGEKNLLAAKGVMILNQDRPGFPIEVRHGLSTDMSSIQMREISVTELADFVAKAVRPALRNYIGQNITNRLITMVEGSVNSVLESLIRAGNILPGSSVTEIFQVETSPDTIAVKVRVNVPYPCNYIDVVVAYE